MNRLSSKLLYRVKLKLNEINETFNTYISLKGSREKAFAIWVQLQKQNGTVVVCETLLKEIKQYCKQAFGDEDFWPWLAVYSELTGEFKKGWLPDEYYRFIFLKEMNPEKFLEFSEAKTFDYKLFKNLIVEPLFFRLNGYYCSKDGEVLHRSDIKGLLGEMDEEIIIKPDRSHGGMGITFKHADELEIDDLPSEGDLLFQTVQQQHDELERLYAHSVNTFRVLTFMDDTGEIRVKFIYLRFGRGGTRVDNGVSGGGWVFVHLNGEIDAVAYDNEGTVIGTCHPDTGTRFTSLEIPFLPKVVSLCKDTHSTFPYSRIIAWDVFVDNKGEARLIEWNTNYPGFWAVEARFGPFFDEVISVGNANI